MQTAFRVAYGLAVAIIFIIFVIFGSRTLFSEPDYPSGSPLGNVYCVDEGCYLNGDKLTEAEEADLSPGNREYVRTFREYFAEREDYFRDVFVFAGALGIAAIVAGALLFRRVDALPLGLVLGGIGAISYGWVESSRGPDEAGEATIFAVATLGLVLVLAGGYWIFGREQPAAQSG